MKDSVKFYLAAAICLLIAGLSALMGHSWSRYQDELETLCAIIAAVALWVGLTFVDHARSVEKEEPR